MQTEIETKPLEKIEDELREGMLLAKCRKCGCMKETLETLGKAVKNVEARSTNGLEGNIASWQSEMEPIKYACLGCQYCFPAVALNVFNQAYPEAAPKDALGCAFEVKEQIWPPVPGEYKVLCEDGKCPVAISTLGSPDLADRLARLRPEEVCIVGKTETENIGIDKVIKNTITNRAIRFLVLAGSDPKGHLAGQTLISLLANGVDEKMRVIGSKGKRPILRNVTVAEVESFRKQVQVVDLVGCEDIETIVEKIKELPMTHKTSCGCAECDDTIAVAETTDVPVVQAKEPSKIQMDKAGYFVVLPQPEKATLLVEHYGYDDKLLRTIQGKDARSLYWTIIENNWVTLLSHSAYLGKELIKAELSLKYGFKYIQDGA
jgi:tetrahydromethanopterin S-methyltransferase subunit A